MDVDHDGAFVNPGSGGGVVHNAGAVVITSVRQLPVGDTLSLKRKYNACRGIVMFRNIEITADIIITGTVGRSSCCAAYADSGLLKGTEPVFSELQVNRPCPWPAVLVSAVASPARQTAAEGSSTHGAVSAPDRPWPGTPFPSYLPGTLYPRRRCRNESRRFHPGTRRRCSKRQKRSSRVIPARFRRYR